MAKRLTDTEKWDRQWFLSIPGAYRSFWLYLCDRCDFAGVWNKNMPLAQIYVGFDLDEKKALEFFGGRVVEIAPDKWFVSRFVTFQYGTYRQAKSVHRAVMAKLAANGLRWHSQDLGKGIAKGFGKSCHKDKDKDLDKAKAKAKDKAFVGGTRGA